MLFQVRTDSPVPIYEQIVSQIIFAVAAGDLPAGSLIPSVRELAQQLLVHPNTVARAFQELERAGVVAPRRGRGMEVKAEAPARCRQVRREIVRSRIREALREAVASALEPEDVYAMVQEEWGKVNGQRSRATANRRTSDE